MRARLFGRKSSGGKVEILIERIVGEQQVLAQVRASKPPKPGSQITLDGEEDLDVIAKSGEFYELACRGNRNIAEILESWGHIPLPPYLGREDTCLDEERYQTVFAEQPGAVAAPTAGLHFTQELLDVLRKRGVKLIFITLHVGAGTFQPVRVEQIDRHRMHHEQMEVSESVCAAVRETRQRGGRVIAVGTTSVRALETAAQSGEIRPFAGETDIFIYPGYSFRCVDALITNFHLPKSTLLMLVCAFAGRENVLQAYRHAVKQGYRFFSYGDAMFLTPHAV